MSEYKTKVFLFNHAALKYILGLNFEVSLMFILNLRVFAGWEIKWENLPVRCEHWSSRVYRPLPATVTKTVMYFLQDICSHCSNTEHPFKTLSNVGLYIIIYNPVPDVTKKRMGSFVSGFSQGFLCLREFFPGQCLARDRNLHISFKAALCLYLLLKVEPEMDSLLDF